MSGGTHSGGTLDDGTAAGDANAAESSADGGDPRLQDGVEHLQRAAREMIAASRALLDVVEDLVEHPDGVKELLGAVGSLGDVAGRAMRSAGGRAGSRGAASAGGGGQDEDDDDPPVQRIPVS